MIMASPGEFKVQCRGACGHIMAAFDMHERCACCRDKKLDQDPCVKDNLCSICDNLSDLQKETLSMPSYRIHKGRKAGLLVSPKEVTVLSSIKKLSSDSFCAASTGITSFCAGTCYGFYFNTKGFLCYMRAVFRNVREDGWTFCAFWGIAFKGKCFQCS